MPSIKKPRRGSLQFWPRKRAKRIYPATSHWPQIKEETALGFAGWKVGMTHVQYTDNNSNSSTYGKTISKPATILDASPLFVCGFRLYKESRCIGEKWSEKLPKGAERKIGKGKRQKFEEKDFDDVRLIVLTQPEKGGIDKIKAELFEIGIGGTKKLEYAKAMLGKELNPQDIFKPGEYVDVSGVTKGHGFTGPVKRFGIRIQGRKDQQHHRHAGSIGSTVPRKIDWRVPLPGQHGFHTRTEFTKKVLLIADANKIMPKGGFLGYGNPKHVLLVEGSVPGSRKRLIRLRKTVRPRVMIPVDVNFISRQSKQGR